MKTAMIVLFILAALLGAALYLYLIGSVASAVAAAILALVLVGALFTDGRVIATHREDDARRKDKEDLHLYYKDKGDG